MRRRSGGNGGNLGMKIDIFGAFDLQHIVLFLKVMDFRYTYPQKGHGLGVNGERLR